MPWPISICSKLERTCPLGSSPSSTTCSARNTASARREVEDIDGIHVDSLKSSPQQHSRLEFEEFRRALEKLLPDQREALILVGASGFSYEEAAAICESAVGTIKSRVNRARTRLSKLLSIDSADMFGQDNTTRAVLTGSWRG